MIISSPSSKKSKRRNHRVSRIEALEDRDMLSVSPWSPADEHDNNPVYTLAYENAPIVYESNSVQTAAEKVPVANANVGGVTQNDFNAIKAKYADINLGNYADYNIIEISADELSEAKLRAAINAAGTTSKNDLIVVRTTAAKNSITLSGSGWDTGLEIDFNASTQGSVTIVSMGDENLIIDANGHEGSLGFYIGSQSTVSLAGLTITNGDTGINNAGVMTITNCTISGNSFNSNSGGIFHSSTGTLTVSNSTITNNNAFGIYAMGTGALTVTNCSISDNAGTGIYTEISFITVTNCSISGNSGGGINHYISVYINYTTTLTVLNSTISNNQGAIVGGIRSEGTLTVTNSTISGNSTSAYTSFGGGIYCNGPSLTVTNSTISDNHATYGGGIYSRYSTTITNSTISDNSAGVGGGIDSMNTLTVTNSTISGNYAEIGGGICGGSMIITNSTIVANTDAYDDAGIIITSEDSSTVVTLYNTIVITNDSNEDSDIFDWPQTGNFGGIRGYNNLTSFTGWTGNSGNNIEYDSKIPLFVDAANGDYRLSGNSQALDKGNNQYALAAGLDENSRDMAGNSRFVGTIDIGAYEYYVDTTAPTSKVSALPSTVTPSFTVRWSGSDTGSGIAYYEIYVSVDGGEYELWHKTDTAAETSYQYENAVIGSTYAFHSIAYDNQGNAEAEKTAAEATVTVVDTVSLADFSVAKPTCDETGTVAMTWSELGSDFYYRVSKAGRIVGDYDAATFTDILAEGEIGSYTVIAMRKGSKDQSDVITVVAWSPSVRALDDIQIAVLNDEQVQLTWTAQSDMTYTVYRAGRIVSASNFHGGGWTDTEPFQTAPNLYHIVARYNDDNGDRQVTYSNTYTVKMSQPFASPASARDEFWTRYGQTQEDLLTLEM